MSGVSYGYHSSTESTTHLPSRSVPNMYPLLSLYIRLTILHDLVPLCLYTYCSISLSRTLYHYLMHLVYIETILMWMMYDILLLHWYCLVHYCRALLLMYIHWYCVSYSVLSTNAIGGVYMSVICYMYVLELLCYLSVVSIRLEH